MIFYIFFSYAFFLLWFFFFYSLVVAGTGTCTQTCTMTSALVRVGSSSIILRARFQSIYIIFNLNFFIKSKPCTMSFKAVGKVILKSKEGRSSICWFGRLLYEEEFLTRYIAVYFCRNIIYKSVWIVSLHIYDGTFRIQRCNQDLRV